MPTVSNTKLSAKLEITIYIQDGEGGRIIAVWPTEHPSLAAQDGTIHNSRARSRSRRPQTICCASPQLSVPREEGLRCCDCCLKIARFIHPVYPSYPWMAQMFALYNLQYNGRECPPS
jgi:hypothetical protein